MRDRILKILALAGWINVIAFIAVAIYLGGDALNGKAVAGHYFLNSHGRYTEVGRAVFIYSACHAITAMVGVFLALFVSARAKRNSN